MRTTDALRRAVNGRRRLESRTGLVIDLDRREDLRRLDAMLASEPNLALVGLWAVTPETQPLPGDVFEARLTLMVERCTRRGVPGDDFDRLRRDIEHASPAAARAMLALVTQALAGAPFVLALLRSAPGATPAASTGEPAPTDLSAAWIDRVARLVGITIHRSPSVDGVLAAPFVRPSCSAVTSAADRLLVDVMLGPAENVAHAWSTWLATTPHAVDVQYGFSTLAPIVQERLDLAGVVDAESDRLLGVRRRAWFLNSLLIADATEAVERLRAASIEPVLFGDLVTALEAERRGAVRPASQLSILVEPHEASAALATLAPMIDDGAASRPMTAINLDRHGRIILPVAGTRQLLLATRWLPQHCSTVVGTPALDEFELDGRPVRVTAPTARLLELWATAHMADPGHMLQIVAATGELLERHHAAIDWPWLHDACDRLQLLGVARAQHDSLPPRLRDLMPLEV